MEVNDFVCRRLSRRVTIYLKYYHRDCLTLVPFSAKKKKGSLYNLWTIVTIPWFVTTPAILLSTSFLVQTFSVANFSCNETLAGKSQKKIVGK